MQSSIVAFLLSFIRQPRVVSEIITGIILGPTVLGRLPDFSSTIFPEDSLHTFENIADIGLIFFLFIIGLEIDLELLRENYKKSAFISLTGFTIPFCVGLLIALYLVAEGYLPDNADVVHFYLFLGGHIP